jgi:hypothetical protein
MDLPQSCRDFVTDIVIAPAFLSASAARFASFRRDHSDRLSSSTTSLTRRPERLQALFDKGHNAGKIPSIRVVGGSGASRPADRDVHERGIAEVAHFGAQLHEI